MAYREYRPHALLAGIVDCYWSFKSDVIQPQTIFPDSCSDILFNFGDPMVISANGTESRSKGTAFAVGTMTHSILTAGSGRQDLFGIRFKPGGISSVIRDPKHAMTDNSIDMNDCSHSMPADLPERIREMAGEDRVGLVEGWLLQHATVSAKKSGWQWAVNRILSAHGNIRIKDLALEVAISGKQLERHFLQHVGVTPKQLGTIARFCEAKRRLANQNISLEDLAWDLGYSDHAHFSKSFRTFAGFSPSEYVRMAD
jgi:AraC-like DNA-binding protein